MRKTCEWSPWGEWDVSACSDCSAKGQKLRKRAFKEEAGQCGWKTECKGKKKQEMECDKPEVVDCVWGEWGSWESDRGKGKCSNECGPGKRYRYRKKKTVENECGKCTGGDKMVEDCQEHDPREDAKCFYDMPSVCKATTGDCKAPKCKTTRTLKQVPEGTLFECLYCLSWPTLLANTFGSQALHPTLSWVPIHLCPFACHR